MQCHQGRLYLLAAGAQAAGLPDGPALWVSGDGGRTWATPPSPPPSGSVSLGLLGFLGRLQAFPQGLASGGTVPISDSGGSTWA
jgi:hypothetical protein